MPRKQNFTNKHFPDVRVKIWYEDEFYKFMVSNGLLSIPENNIMFLIKTWNAGIEHSITLSLQNKEDFNE